MRIWSLGEVLMFFLICLGFFSMWAKANLSPEIKDAAKGAATKKILNLIGRWLS